MGFCKRRAAEIIAEFDVAKANKKKSNFHSTDFLHFSI